MTIDKQELFDNLHEFEKSIINVRTAISNLTVIDFDENSENAAKFYYEYKDAKDIMTQKLEEFEKVISDKIKADSENLKAKFKEEMERVKAERAEAEAAAKKAEDALNKIAETYRKDELARIEAARVVAKEKADKEALEAKEAEANTMSVATAEPEETAEEENAAWDKSISKLWDEAVADEDDYVLVRDTDFKEGADIQSTYRVKRSDLTAEQLENIVDPSEYKSPVLEGGAVLNYAEEDDLNDAPVTESPEAEGAEEPTKPKRSRAKAK